MKNRTWAALALALAATWAGGSAADDAITLPLVEDIPVLDGIATGSGDVLGIRFGDNYDDAMAALKSALPSADITENTYATRIGDNSGNSITFKYREEIVANLDGTPSQTVKVRFTTDTTGGRVYQILRYIQYPDDGLGSTDELRASMEQKYGTPVLVEPTSGWTEVTYTWEKGDVASFGTVTEHPFNKPSPDQLDPCLLAVTSSAYSSSQGDNGYHFVQLVSGERQPNPGWDRCIAGIKFVIFNGNNDKTVRRVEVTATDYARSLQDGRIADRTILKLIDDQRNAVVGAGAPKL